MASIVQKLNYFINKPVTVFTNNTGRKFSDEQFNDYFTGICVSVDEDGIETIHPITGCKNLFLLNSIVGICEEQQLDPENPEHKEIIKEMESRPAEKTVDQNLKFNIGDNINIEELNKMLPKN